ncbi:hypothetical protein [Liquorilactobacillus capillatus]|uniref:Uncharacterized protein n=1 Tax=Liquorilactobacillus capillatus DSM 19910 TaxID=1423731 RepID=A0A0R1MB35_9LACO|nr:hypothetical protein [Liquorilactobacillus capillatus]KRL02437.1 hypothetical protein FC81_GL000781 [Liquorilactobacillus capillatus DSM 19910]
MLQNKLVIDPNEFAMNLVKDAVKQPGVTNQRFIKEQLTLYLESYYMIKEFNELETSQFETMKHQQISELFDKMLLGRFNP